MPLTPWLLEELRPGLGVWRAGRGDGARDDRVLAGALQVRPHPAERQRVLPRDVQRDGLRAIANLVPLYLFMVLPFLCLFDQTHSSWVHQAQEHESASVLRLIPRCLPAQMQTVNPILMLAFIPLFSYGIYPFAGRFFEVTPLRKIGIGLFVTVIAVRDSVAGPAEHRSPAARRTSAGRFLAYVLMTAAEVMVSITVLEFSYTQAPRKMKSFVMGVFLLSMTLGNLFTAPGQRVHRRSKGGRQYVLWRVRTTSGSSRR